MDPAVTQHDHHPDLIAARETAARVCGHASRPSAYLEFRLAVLELSRSPAPPSGGTRAVAVPSREAAERSLREGVPLLPPGTGPGAAFPGVLRRIAETMKGAGIEGAAALLEAVAKEGEGRPDLGALARAVTGRDAQALGETAGRIGISPSLLRFAVAHALFPELSACAEALRPSLRDDVWMRGGCPVCGAEPDAGRIVRKPEGARVLHCPACGTSWRFKRLGCPYCGNETPAELEVLFEDAPSARRVAACRKCRRYLKETDERRLPEGVEANPVAEDIVSLDLDLAAEARGYRN